ncbi:MAG: hypothetical protein JJV93_01760 [Alphaproteobacteria bacterium]|nr:hypothetical protein [Alphaproteobacteria bacterium]
MPAKKSNNLKKSVKNTAKKTVVKKTPVKKVAINKVVKKAPVKKVAVKKPVAKKPVSKVKTSAKKKIAVKSPAKIVKVASVDNSRSRLFQKLKQPIGQANYIQQLFIIFISVILLSLTSLIYSTTPVGVENDTNSLNIVLFSVILLLFIVLAIYTIRLMISRLKTMNLSRWYILTIFSPLSTFLGYSLWLHKDEKQVPSTRENKLGKFIAKYRLQVFCLFFAFGIFSVIEQLVISVNIQSFIEFIAMLFGILGLILILYSWKFKDNIVVIRKFLKVGLYFVPLYFLILSMLFITLN